MSDPAPSTHSDADPPEADSAPSLARALHDRRVEFVRPHRLRLKIGTWNVAARPGTDKDLASWFIDGRGLDETLSNLKVSPDRTDDVARDVSAPEGVRLVGDDKIGLYVLGLQEIVDLGLAKEAYSRMYADYSPIDKWRAALEAAMPPGYELVSAEQMSGLALLIYASPEVASSVSHVSTSQVGTGLLGYMGNKGAISTRVVLGETTRLVFINSHLASGPEQAYLDRRCWDVSQILARTQFEALALAGVEGGEPERIGDEDFAFWLGDLNFRVDGLPGDDIRRLLRLHTQGEYDLSRPSRRSSSLEENVIVMKADDDDDDGGGDEVTDRSTSPSPDASSDTAETSLPDPDDFLPKDDSSSDFLPDPHEDPASLQATLDSILPHDQLRRLMRAKKVLHEGWREAPIAFLPTYKYDVGTVALFDSSEKQRAPSWCDRVLYRTRRDLEAYRESVREEEEARRRDEELRARGIDEAAEDDDVLFSYDPEADGLGGGAAEYEYDEYDEGAAEPEEVVTKEGFTDRIRMDLYASHQKVTSSDHKPVVSLFTLDYDAVVPELKAAVHAEVARELDRAENEGRPNVTVVVERQNSGKEGHEPGSDGAVDFGDVAFLGRRSCALMVANTGGVEARFSFVEKPCVEGGGDASWLSSRFLSTDESGQEELGEKVTLQPGETARVLLEALVDDVSLAESLNHGRTSLEDVLVLRVEDGRDYFVPVRATWLPTTFSRSVEELVRIPRGGIRALAEKGEVDGAIPAEREVQSAAPRALLALTEALEGLLERAVADENMLEGCAVPRSDGWPFDASTWGVAEPVLSEATSALAAALDRDEPLARALPPELPAVRSLEVLSSALLLFLRSLPDGLVPASLNPHLPALSKEPQDTKTAFLDLLSSGASPSHNVSFVFLAATLARVMEAVPRSERRGLSKMLRGEEGRRRRERVAAVLAPAVFRAGRREEDRARALLQLFLRRD